MSIYYHMCFPFAMLILDENGLLFLLKSHNIFKSGSPFSIKNMPVSQRILEYMFLLYYVKFCYIIQLIRKISKILGKLFLL